MKKKSAIIIAIILMSIGFAVVSTTLIINGNANVSENNEDFSVIFTAASIDGNDVYSTAVDDTKKIITFETSELKTLNQTSILTYEVTNNSSQYDAKVNVTCVPKTGTTAKYTNMKNKLDNDATVVKAKTSVNGTLIVTLNKTATEEVSEEYTCKLEFNAVERENIGYNGPTEWVFDYTGGEQTFTTPVSGTYKLEVWGAQGGSINETYYGGYGAYSAGEINIKNKDILYINTGGSGQKFTYPSSVDTSPMNKIKAYGGYNGGGNGLGYWTSSPGAKQFNTSGGGVTHIAKTSGLLSTLEAQKSKVFIVASGGGGAQYFTINELYSYCIGASGGGITGTIKYCDSNFTSDYLENVTNATQLSGGTSTYNNFSPVVGSFGQGGTAYTGGGGGFYGGSSNGGISASGSGYIGNSELSEKVMYCYNCQESSEESTKTISTTCTSATPTENCAKQGNGYARITLIK